MYMHLRWWLLVWVVSVVWPASVPASEPISVAVMEFTSKGGVTQKQMDALGDLLANEIREAGDYRVIGKSDIQAALDMEQRRELVGCTDNSCFAEIGGALGVRWVVVGNVGKFGEYYLLNLKILDVEKIRVAKGVSEKVEGGEGELIDALTRGARELVAGSIGLIKKEALRQQEKPDTGDKIVIAPPPPAVEEEAPSGRFGVWVPLTFWSGVGLLVVGGASATVAYLRAEDYRDEYQTDRARLYAADDSRAWAGAMWVSFGLGVALVATGTVLWFLDSPEGEAGSSAAAAPTADGQGMVFMVGGRW
jgi:hypothetical protein